MSVLKNLPNAVTRIHKEIFPVMGYGSVVVDKQLFDLIGGFRGLPEKADYDLWLNILKTTDLLYVDEPLFYYDGKHGDGKNYN